MKYLIVTETQLSKPMQYVFWRLLEGQGIQKEECSILPLLADFLPAGKGQKITSAQYASITGDFRRTFAASDAEVVILCGGEAFRAVTGLKWKIDNVAAYILTPEDCVPVATRQRIQIGTYATSNKARGVTKGDPKFAMRLVQAPSPLPQGVRILVPSITVENVIKSRYANVTQFRAAFNNARRYSAGEPLIDDDFRWEPQLPPLGHFDGTDFEGLPWHGVVSYDLEVPIGSTAIERASLASESGTWSFPWDFHAVAMFKRAMKGAQLRVAHNEQFDRPILAAHGIDVPSPTFDTMLAASLLEPNLPKGLIAVAPIYLLVRPWKHLSETRGFADPYYNAKDSFVERELALVLIEKLKETGMSSLFATMMKAVPVLMDMKEKGIRIDPHATIEWTTALERDLQAATREWVMRYPDVNPNSPKQLQGLFYGKWGCRKVVRKGDGIRTDAYAIRLLADDYPNHRTDLALLIRIREAGKDLETYGRTALGRDYVHPSYLPVGKDGTERGVDRQKGKGLAATGRLATSNPNIQNQPMDARKMYVPDHKDWCFVEFDWSQAELRVAAAMAGDKVMLEALDHDIHAVTMERMGCDRTRAKNTLYGSAYGAGPRKIQETLLEKSGIKVPLKEVQDLQRGLAETFPTWWAWRLSTAEEAARRQYAVNPFGRVRRFPMGSSDTPAILDFLPQSIIGDMAWELYLAVWLMMNEFGGRLTTVVHDSFLTQCHASTVPLVMGNVKALLERHFDIIAPGFYLPVEVKVGKPGASWAELEKV